MAASQAKIPTIVPQGRSGEAEEVAKVAMFLSSSMSSYVNGHNREVSLSGWHDTVEFDQLQTAVFVDGGWNAA